MSKRILLIGESCLDVFVAGVCNRVNPEAPCLIHEPLHTETNEGMAGNVRANLASLAPDLKIDFFHQTKDILKIRYIDSVSGHQLLRVDEGNDSFEPDFWQTVIRGMAANKDGYSCLVISDYGKGLLSTTMMAALVEVARELGIPSFADTKALLGEWSKDIDYVKINDKEFAAHIKAGVKPWRWCRNLIVTKGKDGMILYGQDGEVKYHAKLTSPLRMWCLSGAGDSALAGLVIRHLETRDIIQSMDFANKVAAIAVSKPGVVAVARHEVEELR